MTGNNDTLPFLDSYEVGGKTVWCWKRWNEESAEELASEEYPSEEMALNALRSDRINWSKLSNLGG